ncbi:MAG: S8 family peptidase [Saprospiraceae bacterium]
MQFKKIALVFALCLPGLFLTAQGQSAPENWFTKDKAADGVQGTSSDAALKALKAKGKKGQTIIVAVLDSGVDYKHEDLADVMWVNPGEIPGNGIDDDKNGYIDDIHGWNFIGGKDGRNVSHDSYELAREYARLKAKYGDATSGSDKKEFAYWQTIKSDFEQKRGELEGQKAMVDAYFSSFEEAIATAKKELGKSTVSSDDVEALKNGSDAAKEAAAVLERGFSNGLTEENVAEQKEQAGDYFSGGLEYGYNPDFNPRDIVGDNYNDLSNRSYGNSDVKGPDSFHGTHVAGIIAASRNNDKGIQGVADNVRIMSVRCVPDGDERDKDVANAIRYAVDNGASIINMSFGKGYSPSKEYVDEAVKYAAEHDVLLVHAAGNDAESNDVEPNFPNDKYTKKGGLFKPKNAPNWLEVGALHWRTGERSVANFSNYGKTNVDIFSPGVALYSTIPEGGYGNASGTSMASPAAAGVAAIIRSYYPELNAKQVKSIMETSVVKQTGEVFKPGSTEKVPFSDLCASGGVVSATNAIALAEKTAPKKNKKAIWQAAGLGKSGKTKVVTP